MRKSLGPKLVRKLTVLVEISAKKVEPEDEMPEPENGVLQAEADQEGIPPWTWNPLEDDSDGQSEVSEVVTDALVVGRASAPALKNWEDRGVHWSSVAVR